jgi:hypothetical protein
MAANRKNLAWSHICRRRGAATKGAVGALVHVRDLKIGKADWRLPVEHAPPQSGDLKQGN